MASAFSILIVLPLYIAYYPLAAFSSKDSTFGGFSQYTESLAISAQGRRSAVSLDKEKLAPVPSAGATGQAGQAETICSADPSASPSLR